MSTRRIIGLLLITASFVAGSLVSIWDPAVIDWTHFTIAMVIGVVGVAIVQIDIRRQATSEEALQGNFETLDKALAAIVKDMKTLEGDKTSLDVYELPDRIDETFREEIHHFVEAREAIAHLWGMQAYADVMTHFAAGERYLNRVWSTAADGYIDEAHVYVAKSLEQFEQALGRLEALEVPQAAGA